MTEMTRRAFVKASSALGAAPLLATAGARAQPRAPDIGNLRAEKDIVFGKGGDIDLLLDVYRPPVGVTSKRLAIVHLFGGGFRGGNKAAGYIINDAKALGSRGYTNVSATYRLQSQASWPAQIHDVKAAIRWTRANADRLEAFANDHYLDRVEHLSRFGVTDPALPPNPLPGDPPAPPSDPLTQPTGGTTGPTAP